MSKGCPHCGKVQYPVQNEDNSINWKNVLRIDWVAVLMVIGIVCMLYGFKQINNQCYEYLEHPCDKFKQFCSPVNYSKGEGLNLPQIDISSITLENDKVVVEKTGTD